MYAAAAALFAILIAGAVTVTWSRESRNLGFESSPINSAYVSTYEVLNTFPHDPDSFTQGLTFDEHGTLYESDGLYGRSGVRIVEVHTGKSKTRTTNERSVRATSLVVCCLLVPFLSPLTRLFFWSLSLLASPNLPLEPHLQHFGEGLQVVGQRLLQLTWKEQVLNEYKLPELTKVTTHRMPCAPTCREGWGLAYDEAANKLYMTDSTDKLFTLNPATLEPIGAPKQIYDPRLGRPINGVNELEYVDGELWGNVFPMYQGTASECVVRINATDATVIGWLDLRGLLGKQRQAVRANSHNYVLNGIAYHHTSGRLYVTGKQWDHMYQIRVKPAEASQQTAAYVHVACSLGAVGRG